ncbi:MAG: S1C family serine protease [Rhodothermia bacterium]
MIDYSTNTVFDESYAVNASRRPISHLDWLYGCVALALIAISIGVVVEWWYLELTGYECFLCPDDIGWPAFTFAYAIPGLAFGSVIWALMSLGRLRHEAKSDQFKSIVVILFISVALLMAAIYYLYWLPAAQNNLNIDPELKTSVVRISSTVDAYSHPDEPSGTGFGTGLVVDSERGWIVTNAHVARRVPSENSFFFSVDPARQFYPAKKIYVDPYLDIAVLQGPQNRFQAPVRSATLDCEGEFERELVALGYTGRSDPTLEVVKGSGRGLRVMYGKTWIEAYAGYKHGMSGGPTIGRRSGRVVGFNTIGYGHEPDDLGYAVPARYVCRILKLLRNGVDPAPPRIPLAFYDNLADLGALVVAEIDPSAIGNPLLEGDIILGVEGFEEPISSESDLIDVLRGASYPINLRITRDGTERLVSVSFARMEDQPRPELLYVSRFVIGEARGSNRYPDGLKRELMIRMAEEPGFDEVGDVLEEYESYIIVSVDGIVFKDLRSLHRYLSSRQDTNQRAVFKLKKPEPQEGMSYTYHRISIAPDDLRLL